MLYKEKNAPVRVQIPISHARLSFLKDRELSGISDKRIQIMSYTTRRFIEYIDAQDINEVNPLMAKNFYNHRMNQRTHISYRSFEDDYIPKVSNSTLKKELQILKQFFNYCIDMEWIDKNPFRLVKPPKINTHKQRYYFTKSNIKMIFNNADKYYDFYYLLLHTGIRSTDAFKLKPENIDGKYLKIQMNKTGDFLCIPIPQHVLDVLKHRMNSSVLFPTLNNSWERSRCVKNIQRLFKPSFVRDNNINLHTFRHTYAHHMLNKGVPKEVLQTLLGHRSIKTTEIYANWVRKEELEKWV